MFHGVTDAAMRSKDTNPDHMKPKPKKKKKKVTKSEVPRVEVKPSNSTNNFPSILAKSIDLSISSTGYYHILLETRHAEMLCRSLGLQYRHIARLRHVFNKEDLDRSGFITLDEFFKIIHEEKRKLTLGLFPFAGLDGNLRHLNFDHFVIAIVTLSSMSRDELLQYAFSVFDHDESGIMDQRELQEFCKGMKNQDFFFQKNINVAQRKLVDGVNSQNKTLPGDGLVDLEDLTEKSAHFPVAFYPIIQFQRHAQSSTLGEAFWVDVLEKKVQIENVVTYMRLHNGHLPPLEINDRIRSWVSRFMNIVTAGNIFDGGMVALHKAAVNKYAEELHNEQHPGANETEKPDIEK